ncbi:uncharacterized protein BDV17DRAFT_74462 [Aspergillus undulatus]|uniref:uncharacterized protein n=1 Tax=Aspergillus undulatus TaxID=1810928 RepID=UPI003CCDC55A
MWHDHLRPCISLRGAWLVSGSPSVKSLKTHACPAMIPVTSAQSRRRAAQSNASCFAEWGALWLYYCRWQQGSSYSSLSDNGFGSSDLQKASSSFLDRKVRIQLSSSSRTNRTIQLTLFLWLHRISNNREPSRRPESPHLPNFPRPLEGLWPYIQAQHLGEYARHHLFAKKSPTTLWPVAAQYPLIDEVYIWCDSSQAAEISSLRRVKKILTGLVVAPGIGVEEGALVRRC